MIDRVIDLMQVAPRDRILDLGCGEGAATRRLARLARDGMALGVDSSDDKVRAARRLSVEIENVMFVLGSPEAIPWRDDFFSALLSAEPGREWLHPDRAAREIFRVMAPGGRVFVVDPLSDWADLFTAAGFDPVETRRIREDPPAPVLAATKPAPAPGGNVPLSRTRFL